MSYHQKNKNPPTAVRRIEKPSYKLDRSKLIRFNRNDTVFKRVKSDQSWAGYEHMYDEKVPAILKLRKPGYSRIDFALASASWIVHDSYEGAFSREKIKLFRIPGDTVGFDWTKTKLEIDDPHKMNMIVKRAARLFGASLTGICRLNKDWLYADAEVSEGIKNSIVMAVEMDIEGIGTSPAVPAAAATGIGYSRMAFTLACVAEFIRNLGYQAIQCGNDTALSIPLAVDAGLGELGRNGLLLTPEFGPRIRLCKILTDIPLEPDKPIEFGVEAFCTKCKLCAKKCEANAISMTDKPNFNPVSSSNSPGVLKWYVNPELCYQFWCKNGIDCSTCIRVCPYNIASARKARVSPEQFWNCCAPALDVEQTATRLFSSKKRQTKKD